MALVNAVSGGGGEEPGPSPAASTTGGGTKSTDRSSAQSSATLPLVLRVTGPATNVIVKVSTSGEILTQGVLATGETRKYEESPLQVVAYNGSSLQVVIYGEEQPAKPAGRATWFVNRQR
ncbi:hypothetical protein [Actinomadura fibrosa]|uniref:DUF4115 domain-containing protein n=1 Tax=Actinomadura fibrosa TaxID=111802 RepID=A0ABW2XDF4_9ACTN|nr:hypothetical protein [Actinomadura fibrosa]